MGQMKNWALEIMHELTEEFMKSGQLEQAVDNLVERYWATGQFADRAWLRDQVQAVANHHEMCGYELEYWHRMKRLRVSGARRRARLRGPWIGGTSANREESQKGSQSKADSEAYPS